jgi:hypothetical protein
MHSNDPRNVDLTLAKRNLIRLHKCYITLAKARKDLQKTIKAVGLDLVNPWALRRVRDAREWRKEILNWLTWDTRQIALDHGFKMIKEFNQFLNRYKTSIV